MVLPQWQRQIPIGDSLADSRIFQAAPSFSLTGCPGCLSIAFKSKCCVRTQDISIQFQWTRALIQRLIQVGLKTVRHLHTNSYCSMPRSSGASVNGGGKKSIITQLLPSSRWTTSSAFEAAAMCWMPARARSSPTATSNPVSMLRMRMSWTCCGLCHKS